MRNFWVAVMVPSDDLPEAILTISAKFPELIVTEAEDVPDGASGASVPKAKHKEVTTTGLEHLSQGRKFENRSINSTIIGLLTGGGAKTVTQIERELKRCGFSPNSASPSLAKLMKAHSITRVSTGKYAMPAVVAAASTT